MLNTEIYRQNLYREKKTFSKKCVNVFCAVCRCTIGTVYVKNVIWSLKKWRQQTLNKKSKSMLSVDLLRPFADSVKYRWVLNTPLECSIDVQSEIFGNDDVNKSSIAERIC